METNEEIRINKFVASRMNIGRRQADDFIERGAVTINGQQAGLGARVNPQTDAVAVNGMSLGTIAQTEYLYVSLHKPIGYVSSRKQQGESPTIYSLLPSNLHHLKPVGRLDKDSSGLLLLTNDGDFTHQQTHPSFYKTKRYEITIDKSLEPLHQQMINDHGIALEDGPSKLQLERLKEGDNTKWVVIMHEGRNRQIRRTFAALGYTVTALHRTHFGKFELGALAKGKFITVKP